MQMNKMKMQIKAHTYTHSHIQAILGIEEHVLADLMRSTKKQR